MHAVALSNESLAVRTSHVDLAEYTLSVLQVVYDFSDSLEGLNSLKYSLATMHPKVMYGSDKLQQSLKQLGLAPQAVLLVQPHDDD